MISAPRWKALVEHSILGVGLVAGMLITAGCGDAQESGPGELRDAVRIEGAPMCPWRNPAADIAIWFPGATRSESEVRILSALRPELGRRLGRVPTAEENSLYLHPVFQGSRCVGEVAVRRVKGESGAVEIAVAFEPDGRIRAVRLQRSREPEAVAAALDEKWLAGFRGRTASDPRPSDDDLASVPESARITARAIADGIRSLLILRELAASPGALRRPAPETSVGHLH